MNTVTHVFFDLNGVLVDTVRLAPQYRDALGRFLAERYGGSAGDWADAYRRVVADWNSYYADLDFSGEDSLVHLWEGQTRVLRALFRLTGHAYLAPPEMWQLVEAHHYVVCLQCDALYVDVRPALAALRELSLTLGVVAGSVRGHIRGLLAGAGVLNKFTGPLITPEVVGYVGVDEEYYRLALAQAGVSSRQAIVVTASRQQALAALSMAVRVILVDRSSSESRLRHELPVMGSLQTLPEYLQK